MVILLETDRLRLRRFTRSDVDLLFALDNDPQVMRYINGGTPTPRHIIEQVILPGFIDSYPSQSGFGFWAAESKETGEFLGWFCLRPLPEKLAQAALGYRLMRAVWGQGLATEGVRALIQKGFTDLGLERIVATTYEHNVASRRVLEKSGMRLIRYFRISLDDLQAADTFYTDSAEIWNGDDVEYGLKKTDWQSKRELASGGSPP